MATSIAPDAGVTAQTRKPAGRPPVYNGDNWQRVKEYYTAVNREIPMPVFGRGRCTAEEKTRRETMRSNVAKFNARFRRAD